MTMRCRGVPGSIALNVRQWRRLRTLARLSDNGALHWRVRAFDRGRRHCCESEVKRFVIDGGTWTLSDLDLSAPSPEVSWTNDAPGIARFQLQVSVNEDFSGRARETVILPSRPLTDNTYTFKAREVRRLRILAGRNSASTLYYRIRGMDAQRRFFCYSPGKSTAAP